MFQEGENFPSGESSKEPAGEVTGFQKNGTPLVPIVICACLSVFLMNFSFLSLLYMVPLGYAVLVYNQVWLTFAAVTIINAVFRIFSQMAFGYPGNLSMEIFYFSAWMLLYIWIMGGNKFGNFNLRLVYRFILASAVCSFAVLFLIKDNAAFKSFSIKLFERFSESSSASPEELAELSMFILFRGGAISSFMLIFFVNRHVSLFAASIAGKRKMGRGLKTFFAPANTIWGFLVSLAIILFTRHLNNDFFSIIAWNLFVVCAIIFLVQGVGVIMFLLEKRTRAFRMIICVLVIVLALTLSSMPLVAVLLLGIVDNWFAFRLPRKSALE